MKIFEEILTPNFLAQAASYGFLLVILLNYRPAKIELNKAFFLSGILFWIAALIVRFIVLYTVSIGLRFDQLSDNSGILRIVSFLFPVGRNFVVFGLIVTFSEAFENKYSESIYRLLFFSVITFGLYGIYWIYRKQRLVNGDSNSLLVGLILLFWTLYFSTLGDDKIWFGLGGQIFGICYGILFLTAAFQLKNSLLNKNLFKHYSEFNNFYLFFFTIFYLQFKLNQIREDTIGK